MNLIHKFDTLLFKSITSVHPFCSILLPNKKQVNTGTERGKTNHLKNIVIRNIIRLLA